MKRNPGVLTPAPPPSLAVSRPQGCHRTSWPAGDNGQRVRSCREPGSGKGAPSSDSPLFPARFSLLLRDPSVLQTLTSCPSYNPGLSLTLQIYPLPLACPKFRSLIPSLVIPGCPTLPVCRAFLHSPILGTLPWLLQNTPFLFPPFPWHSKLPARGGGSPLGKTICLS